MNNMKNKQNPILYGGGEAGHRCSRGQYNHSWSIWGVAREPGVVVTTLEVIPSSLVDGQPLQSVFKLFFKIIIIICGFLSNF
jgi:hypothetical protein